LALSLPGKKLHNFPPGKDIQPAIPAIPKSGRNKHCSGKTFAFQHEK
jgi:hypothetical protein